MKRFLRLISITNPNKPRRLEGFFVHMHIAWLYLLQARFRRDGIDFRYRLPNGRFEKIDGEPKTWDLQKCVHERYPDDGPVRKNLEFTIGLRNKIEHRYEEAIAIVAMGYAQALVLNFEEEQTGPRRGSADSLPTTQPECDQVAPSRFPVVEEETKGRTLISRRGGSGSRADRSGRSGVWIIEGTWELGAVAGERPVVVGDSGSWRGCV